MAPALFVRSLATRGRWARLAHATHAAVEVLAAAYDLVLVETVGVGQTEIAVTHVSDTVVLVVQPGSGDVLQFLKAGVMEIPDLAGREQGRPWPHRDACCERPQVRAEHAAAGGGRGGRPGVILTSARDQLGIDKLAEALDAHAQQLGSSGILARRHSGRVEWADE